ncbi:MAG: hypothetical protein KJ593_06935 [Candidatus Omnitrophica bacterium]|nr:hypothetical protein [Candidatus Omnitrophota bacterium]
MKLKIRAVSLIELLILMAVLAISVSPLLFMFNNAFRSQEMNLIITKATFLAQEIMETQTFRDFYDLQNDAIVYLDQTGDFSSLLGICTGNECVQEPDYNFQYSIRCIYPNVADLGSAAAVLPLGEYSNYVRINARVWHNDFPNRVVELATLVTPD